MIINIYCTFQYSNSASSLLKNTELRHSFSILFMSDISSDVMRQRKHFWKCNKKFSSFSVYFGIRKQWWLQFTNTLRRCLLVRMAYSEHCQDIIMCECVCPWIYNVRTGNNTLLGQQCTKQIEKHSLFGSYWMQLS